MMTYTAFRSLYSTGDVALYKTDRENLKTTEEYDTTSEWGLRSHDKGLLRLAGQWWGSSNVLPNQFMAKTFFKPSTD